ncbi:hypothetical protein K1719_009790 [Acacia pycnantha]|nr:hypothetical protein K1719_009790 [Acacia pycnantha]
MRVLVCCSIVVVELGIPRNDVVLVKEISLRKRTRRPRRNVILVQKQSLGSRFSVLNEVNGDEDRHMGGSKGTMAEGRVYRSYKVVPETNLEKYAGRKVDMIGKENLHPGEYIGGVGAMEVRGQVEMDQPSEEEDPIESSGVCTMFLTRSSSNILPVWSHLRHHGCCILSFPTRQKSSAFLSVARKGVAAVLRDMKFRYKLSLVVILEPRISGVQANKVIRNWGFKHSVRKEAEGLNFGKEEMLFSAIYANPNEHQRHKLWSLLKNLASEMPVPWLLAGDFNDIKTPLEQRGGGVNETRCRNFNTWIQDCNLIDFGSNGPFYTWRGPKWDGLERVHKRLDKCFCNVQWQEKFTNVELRVIPRVSSDHHPLLMCVNAMERKNGGRQFKCQAIWHMHVNFNEFMINN